MFRAHILNYIFKKHSSITQSSFMVCLSERMTPCGSLLALAESQAGNRQPRLIILRFTSQGEWPPHHRR